MGDFANELTTVSTICTDLRTALSGVATFDLGPLRNEDPIAAPSSDTVYVIPSITRKFADRLNAGGSFTVKKYRDLIFRIKVPRGSQLSTRDTIADLITTTLRDMTTEGITFEDDADIEAEFYVDDWHVSDLVAPYFRYEITGSSWAMGDNAHIHSQLSHGFTAPAVAYWSSPDALAAASNDDANKAAQVLIVATPDANTLWYATEGVVTVSHGLGSSGDLWLGTSGAISTSETSGVFKQHLGVIPGSTRLQIRIQRPEDA